MSAPAALRTAPTSGITTLRAARAGARSRPSSGPAAPPPPTRTAVAGIDPLVQRDLLDRPHHVLRREPAGPPPPPRPASSPSGVADLARDRLLRGCRIELHRAAEEVVGVDVAEDEARVGHGRPVAAAAVAGGPGSEPALCGPTCSRPPVVDPGDASRRPRRCSSRRPTGSRSCARSSCSPSHVSPRPRDPAAPDEADVEARPAGVGDDRGVGAGVEPRVVAAGHGRHRRARADRVDRRLATALASRTPPPEVTISTRPPKPAAREPLVEPGAGTRLMTGFSDASIAVDEARRYSRMRRVEPMRERVRNARQAARASSSPTRSSCAGLAIDQSRQTATASTLERRQPSAITPTTAPRRAASTTSPPAPIRSGTSNVSARGTYGLGYGAREVEGLGPAALAEQEDVRVARRRQERGPRVAPGQDRVDRAGRPVDEELGLAASSSSRRDRRIGGRQLDHVEHAPIGSSGVVGLLYERSRRRRPRRRGR